MYQKPRYVLITKQSIFNKFSKHNTLAHKLTPHWNVNTESFVREFKFSLVYSFIPGKLDAEREKVNTDIPYPASVLGHGGVTVVLNGKDLFAESKLIENTQKITNKKSHGQSLGIATREVSNNKFIR